MIGHVRLLAFGAINTALGDGSPYKPANSGKRGDGEKPVDQHGSGPRTLGWFCLLRHAPQSRLHSVNDPRRQHIRPLRDSARRNANGLGRFGGGASKQFDCFCLVHAQYLSTLSEQVKAH